MDVQRGGLKDKQKRGRKRLNVGHSHLMGSGLSFWRAENFKLTLTWSWKKDLSKASREREKGVERLGKHIMVHGGSAKENGTRKGNQRHLLGGVQSVPCLPIKGAMNTLQKATTNLTVVRYKTNEPPLWFKERRTTPSLARGQQEDTWET